MKKLSLSVLAILLAGASLFANGHVATKKVKQSTCHTCTKDKCTKKAQCPNTAFCACN
jgi:hypothetical protein